MENNMEWLSLEEIKQSVAYYDKISVSNIFKEVSSPISTTSQGNNG
jgi:hypothetical protein